MTFRQHIEEIRKSQGLELPKQFFEIPVFYFTNPHALVGAHDPVPMPPGCQNLDFECEIGVVIGRDGSNLDPKNAADHVVGFCLFNDWSARDVQRNEMEMRLGPAKGTGHRDDPRPVARDEGRDRAVAAPERATTSRWSSPVNGREYGRDQLGERLLVDRRDHRLRLARARRCARATCLGTGTCGNGCSGRAAGA